MSGVPMVPAEAAELLHWPDIAAAIAAGHALPRASIGDTFLRRGAETLLSRSAFVDGLGALVKTAMVYPGNGAFGLPSVNGAACLFSDRDGTPEAMVDFHLLTRWKTAGDSLLAAMRLAPPEVGRVVVLGAGTVADSLIEAYRSVWPEADYAVWNRTGARAAALAEARGATVVQDLPEAVGLADIVACATMSAAPVLQGDWLRPGTHVDLIGAYRADMREADDAVLRRARIFVDSRETTLEHIGELKIPLADGVIGPEDVLADFYELDGFERAPDDITVFKNGGGAHLDLMVARAILAAWQLRPPG